MLLLSNYFFPFISLEAGAFTSTSPITVFINVVFHIYCQVRSATEVHVGPSRMPSTARTGSRLIVPVLSIYLSEF